MAKLDFQKIAADFFERYRKVDKVFITTDGQPFVDENYAKTHAQAKDLDIETFRRNGEKDVELAEMDRTQLEAFIEANKLVVEFTEATTDEELCELIVKAIEATKPAKKQTSKKAKK